jgi:hypothetical protein
LQYVKLKSLGGSVKYEVLTREEKKSIKNAMEKDIGGNAGNINNCQIIIIL